MKIKVLTLAIATYVLISGCATVESIRYASEFEVCRIAILRPPLLGPEVLYEADNQVRNRPINCSQYAAQIRADQQDGWSEIQGGLDQIRRSTGGSGASPPTTPLSLTCYKIDESISGGLKNCRYNCIGSEAYRTIGKAEICPISIQR